MKKKRDYLLKYWMKYHLNIDELGDVSIRTEYINPKYPDIKYDVSLLNDEKLSALLPLKDANKLLKKYPELILEISVSDEGKQISFPESYIHTFQKDLKLVEKRFPPDKDLVERFINYHNKKLEIKKKRKEKKQKGVM